MSQKARKAYADGRLDGALDLYRRALEVGTLKADDWLFKLRAEYRLGKRDEALETIEDILAEQPQQTEALKTGGRIANVLQESALASDFWQRLAEADPTDADAPLQMARIAFRDGAYADASMWARRLLELEPDHAEALAIAANSGVRLDLAGTAGLLARYFDVDRGKALGLLQQLSRTGDPQNYAATLRAVRDRLPEDREIGQLAADAAEYFMVSGLQAEIQSRDMDAAKFYRSIRRLDPSSANAEKGLERLRRYGIIKMREGFRLKQYDQVIEYGSKVVDIDPECFEARMTLGRAHLLSNDNAKAMECFARAVETGPEDAWAWLNYARTLDHANDWRGALAAFRRVISFGAKANADYLTESERAIRSIYAKALFAGRDAAVRGDMEAAWKHCAVAVEIDPENDNVAVLKKQLLNNMHSQIRGLWHAGSADAIDYCRQYLEHEPADEYVLQVYGRTLMNNRRFGEARPAWEKLASLQPQDAHFRLQIARCCNWLKQREDGIAAARETLRLEPGQAEAENILKQLEALPQH